jgi:MHS family proline/betaine transporter-like MFS transporter
VSSTRTASQGAATISRKRAYFGASFGNAVEWYDFSIYGFLAVYLGANFFSAEDRGTEILTAFAVFGLSFVARPLGGLFFGPLADRHGRKRIMVLVVTIMSACTFAMGLVPSADTIGLWAPTLIVALRLLQGFSAGGEFGSVSAFMSEYAEAGKRGLGVSWMALSTVAAFLVGGMLCTALGASLGDEAMHAWGWRIPFLLGGPLGAVALFIRLRLEDSPVFNRMKAEGATSSSPVSEVFRHPRALLLASGVTVLYGVSFYMVFSYMNTFVTTVADVGAAVTFGALITTGLVAIVALPLTGALSDRIGRKPVLAFAATGYLLLSYPVFTWMATGQPAAIFIGWAVLGFLQASYLATTIATLTELFTDSVRTTGISLGLNIPVALFGGGAPFLATALIAWTGNSIAPAFYLMIAAAVSLVAIAVLKPSDLMAADQSSNITSQSQDARSTSTN